MFKKLILVFITIIFISACSSIHPNYIAKNNIYSVPNITPTILKSESLIYTYNTESLGNQYYYTFCTQLIDCSNNIKNVKNAPEFDGFDLMKNPISNNPYNIKTIKLYQLLYTTTGVNHENETVS